MWNMARKLKIMERLGYKMEFDLELMIPDRSLSLNEGAIAVMGWQSSKDKGSFTNALLQARQCKYTLDGVSQTSLNPLLDYQTVHHDLYIMLDILLQFDLFRQLIQRIEGLSPAISIDQKSTNRNPRSTVGTVTEIYDYFRLLYARIGIPFAPRILMYSRGRIFTVSDIVPSMYLCFFISLLFVSLLLYIFISLYF